MHKLVVLVFFALGSQALDQDYIDRFMEKVGQIAQECAGEANANEDDMAQIIQGEEISRHEGKCLVFCIQKKFHMVNEDGTPDSVGTMDALEELKEADYELYKKVLTICIACTKKVELTDDPCENGTRLMKCGREEAQKLGLDESLFG